MITFTGVLYFVWILFPLFFVVMGCWSWVQRTAGGKRSEKPLDYFKQGIFVGIAVLIAVLLDQYVLQEYLTFLPSHWIKFVQVLTLPITFYLAALLIGGSKPVQIIKAPRPSDRRWR